MTGQIVFNGKGLRPDLQAGGPLDAFYSPKMTLGPGGKSKKFHRENLGLST